MEIIKVTLLGLVEGLTEFLPVSSTGHLILLERLFTLSGTPGFRETFMIVIQLPAILAVVLYFWKQLWPFQPKENTRQICILWFKIGIAFLPAAIFGVLFNDFIEAWFFGSTSVAIALVIGGVIILGIERAQLTPRYEEASDIGWSAALGIGLFQCLAMIPGTSRSAATIIGAMLLGANRRAAAEFSFFLAIPTMMGATVYKTVKTGLHLEIREWTLIALGGFVSFITAYVVVALFMNYIRRHSFTPFGYYRIVLGIFILLFVFL
ncbi:MAG: undecaprenyl-diphosphate phosphatase [Candidatus Hydrogenedentes bacterium]|nr:undecaprenyl-diphosphate phosphatase [Candidatus Hydrogenedentota bacterium]